MQRVKSPRQLIRNGSLILMLSGIIFSCSNESKLANHIPKDANVVLAFDVKSMGLKSLDFKEILTIDNLKKAFSNIGKSDSTGDEFKNSGIDFMNKAYFFGKAAEENKSYGAAVVALTDAKKFEDFLKKLQNDIVITEEGGIKLAKLEDKAMVGWNNTEVLLLLGSENPKETLLSLASLKKEESLASNSDAFEDLEKEGADISCWVSFEDFQKLIPQYSASASAIDLKETFLTATCNFEDGQIVVNSKYTSNEETANKFNFIKPNVSDEVASAMPGQTVIGMLGFALDMDKTYNYLEQEKLLEAYGAAATQFTGLTIKDIFTMLSGDVGVTVNGVTMQDTKAMDWATGQVVTKQVPTPDYCAVIGIADKEKAGKLLAHFAEAGMLTKNDNHYSFQDKVFVIEQGSSLTVTGSASLKQSSLDGKNEKLSDELKGMLSANASSFYLNLNNIPETIYAGANASMGENIKNSEIEDITFTGSGLNGTSTTGKFVVRFKNKSENSLITLGRISKKFGDMFKAPTPIEEPAVVTLEEEETETVAN